MALQIRTGTTADIPTLASLDLAANPSHPVSVLPYATPSDAPIFFRTIFEYYDSLPHYHFLVAVLDEKIVGFLLYDEWVEPGSAPEDPPFPDAPPGTNLAFFDVFVGEWQGVSEPFDKTGCYELEELAVLPEYRRQGVGAALLKRFIEIVDDKKAGCFMRALIMGKALYERHGWKVLAEQKLDLTPFGGEKDFMSWYMHRSVSGTD